MFRRALLRAAANTNTALLPCSTARKALKFSPLQAGYQPLPCRRQSVRCCTTTAAATKPGDRSTTADLERPKSAMPGLGTLPGMSDEDADVLQALDEAVSALGGEDALVSEDGELHPLVKIREQLTTAYRDKAALLKRDWTDEAFQGGEDFNEALVEKFEVALAAGLTENGCGLEHGTNLGNALDLVGTYMKNYKLDKADGMLARCRPFVEDRGGVWMIKFLNHLSTVRMKQSRHYEALEMLYELETYSPYPPEEAPEFYETLYRNFGWALKAMGRVEEATPYFERMTKAAEQHKGSLDWFDRWDVGKLVAARSYRDGDMDEFYRARGMVEEALAMHIEAEPEDLVMRSKVHDSLAECYHVVKEYEQADEHYFAAYDLLRQTVGPLSPLFGKQARHCGNSLIAQERHAEALPFLQEALQVEGTKDAVKLPDLLELVDLTQATQQKASSTNQTQSPSQSLNEQPSHHQVIKAALKNLRKRCLDSSVEYAVLCHKSSLLYLHTAQQDPDALRRASKLAKESCKILESLKNDPKASEWLGIASINARMLASARKQKKRESATS
eukprot:gnl/MRDRNA2_/MRDRNA2_119767_c0_seq1.p1 gnl/MRDRNA2_/MRDRNA2_119767_c0~~gnl/MRDRNA2_/MRDRNA2_119767_c0_seq1.p1  ORF type:complete len:560 (-),score=113.74 gnl/MRDRNA2_/MRDRNA2_119767_c0_seq1:125-1804(-)